jgi:hypothetical protein
LPRILPIFVLLCCLASAGERTAPLVFFRDPDPVTRRRIRDLASNGFDNTNRTTRQETRRALVAIGPWIVPFLAESFRRDPRRAQNAAITLTLLGDRAGLPALRQAARKSNEWVGRTSCLGLGHFRDVADVELLHGRLADRRCRYRAAAALALAKLPGGGAVLVSEDLARDAHVAAAQVLGRALAARRGDLRADLGHREILVRTAAAIGLLVRPLTAADAQVLLDALDRPDAPKERRLRARLLDALAAIPARTPAIRARLVLAAQREKGAEARAAALIGLAREWNVRELFDALGRIDAGDRDPELGPLLSALARSGAPEAVDRLLKDLRGRGDRPFYAAGCLIHLVVAARDGKEHARADEILKAVGEDVDDEQAQPLVTLAKRIRGREWAEQRRIAAADFAEIDDPFGHHLWDWTPEERVWATVNRFLPYLFELDDLADVGDPTKRDQKPVIGLGDSGDGKQKAASQGQPNEQDLIDFLSREHGIPYFGPEDLRGR